MNTKLEMVKNYKTLNDYLENESIPKYIAYKNVSYTENELCNDRGFSFYADVIKNKKVSIEIGESKYLELKEKLEHHSTFNDYYKVEKTTEVKKVLFTSIIANYQKENLMIPTKYMKKLMNMKEELEQGRDDFIETNQLIFTEQALEVVLNQIDYSIQTVDNYLLFFNKLKNDKTNKSYTNKVNRFKTSYKKLLKERYKYSATYFKQLVNEMVNEFGLEDSFEIKKVINEETMSPKTKELKSYRDEMQVLLKEKHKYNREYFKFLKKQLRYKYNLEEKDVEGYFNEH